MTTISEKGSPSPFLCMMLRIYTPGYHQVDGNLEEFE
jgi:hypothetical protein